MPQDSSPPAGQGQTAAGGSVSVIVPVYNVEEYLRACLDSVLGQTYDDLDVIVVDDGSTDGSGRICDQYAQSDRRIRVIHQQNRGLSAARNTGMRAARGEYLTFVDSDDWLSREFVASLVTAILEHRADLAVAGFERAVSQEWEAPVADPEWVPLSRDDALRQLVAGRSVQLAVAWGKLYVRDTLAGTEFPVGRFHEDEFVAHRVLGRTARVIVTDQVLYHYRIRGGSIMAEPHPRGRSDRLIAWQDRADYLLQLGLTREADIMRRRVFRECVRVRNMATAQNEPALARQLSARLREMAVVLSRESWSPRFRVYCLGYRLTPWVMDHAYGLYSRAILRRQARLVGGDRE